MQNTDKQPSRDFSIFDNSQYLDLSRRMVKLTIYICENKGTDQLRSNCEADQRLCFRYTDSTIPLLSKSEISSLQPYYVTVQPGLCRTWSETQIVGFLTHRLICKSDLEQWLCLNVAIWYGLATDKSGLQQPRLCAHLCYQ